MSEFLLPFASAESLSKVGRAATTTIPIVFIAGEDPVKLGLVASLARPGGNLTGINFFSGELEAKRLELLRQLVPAAMRVAVLVNPSGPDAETTLRDVEPAARAIGLQIQVFNASTSREINAAFASFMRQRTNVELARLYRNSGRIADAQIAVQRLAPSADEPIRMIVAAKETGDVLFDRGDLEGALRQFDLAVGTWEGAGRPDLRETGIIYRGVMPWTWRGDVWRERGRTEEALRDYRRALDGAKEAVAQQPDNAQAQRDLSVSLNKIGDVVRTRNDLAGAMKAYEEGLAISRRLAALDANNAQAQRDLSVSLERIGDVLRARNDLAGAMKAYEEENAIHRHLAALDANNAQAQIDLWWSVARVQEVAEAMKASRTLEGDSARPADRRKGGRK
jgi:tetratricopeptide (TPR) repeat protein